MATIRLGRRAWRPDWGKGLTGARPSRPWVRGLPYARPWGSPSRRDSPEPSARAMTPPPLPRGPGERGSEDGEGVSARRLPPAPNPARDEHPGPRVLLTHRLRTSRGHLREESLGEAEVPESVWVTWGRAWTGAAECQKRRPGAAEGTRMGGACESHSGRRQHSQPKSGRPLVLGERAMLS